MSSALPDSSLARLWTADGRVVGAGFLVGKRQILTCAHVISDALDLAGSPLSAPQAVISLDFPLVAPQQHLTACIVLWLPPQSDGSGDIAGLELQSEPPDGAEVIHCVPAGDVWDHPFRAFGFPAGFDDGVWATGRLLGRQAANWVMIEDTKDQGFAVMPGFSGTPVWDTQVQGAVGMVVTASRLKDTRAAFVLPIDVLMSAWPLIATSGEEPRNPYKGLRPFTQDDAGDFFGRDRLVEELVQVLGALLSSEQPATPAKRLLPVIGPSGSGKSSVVMAGLLPRLQQGALAGSEEWVYLEPMRLEKDPLEALVVTLAPYFPDTRLSTLREDLEEKEARGLHLRARLIPKRPGARVVLLVDQFEELFTQTKSEEERQHFIKLLITACSEPEGPLVVLLTMRADFYDRPMQYPDLSYTIQRQQVQVLPMESEDLRATIEEPAALPGVQLTFEDTLIETMLVEMQGQRGALPLLQFTLDRLFQRRSGHQLTLQAYQEIGGVKGALREQAETTYNALSKDQRPLARTLFLRLIELGMTEQDTARRRAPLSELTLEDPIQTELLHKTADAFIRARLLTTGQIAIHLPSSGELTEIPTLEISHEALISEWTRLSTWLLEAREDILFQLALSRNVAEWERRGEPKDRLYRGSQLKDAQAWAKRNTPSKNETTFLRASKQQRIRFWIIVGATLLVLMSTVGVITWLLLRPPTSNPHMFSIDAVVGYNGDNASHPSHFTANYINGQVSIIELPAGDPRRAISYIGPRISTNDSVSLSLEFRDVNGDHRLDMILHVFINNQDHRFIFINNGTEFIPPVNVSGHVHL